MQIYLPVVCMFHAWKMSFMSALEVHTTCLWQALAWLLLLSFPVTVEGHWIEGCVVAVHSCNMLAACLPLAVIFCMHNPNRRHRDPPGREMGPGEMAVARIHHNHHHHHIMRLSSLPSRLPWKTLTNFCHQSRFPVSACFENQTGEGADDIITPMIPPLYFLLSGRMVVRMLACLKGEGLVRRRLWRKQPAANMVVPRSAMTHRHQSQTCHLLPHCFLLWSPKMELQHCLQTCGYWVAVPSGAQLISKKGWSLQPTLTL